MTKAMRSFKKHQRCINGKKKTLNKLGTAQWRVSANKRIFNELRTVVEAKNKSKTQVKDLMSKLQP